MTSFKLKRAFIISMVLLIGAFLIGCAKEDQQKAENIAVEDTTTQAETQTETTMTLDELAKYDGKDGNPAYVAVDGVVYDVSNISKWSSGEHNGNKAGTDISDKILKAPHGVSKLEGLPVVGKLAE